MSEAACTNLIGIGELEASYTMYCKPMGILIRE
ncbi:DUF3136 domain-containing protein [Synechococcus sp. EJ6-Ellesmere]|jgi:hypothetical protein|nr:DUF3136 domain-containing protein [Synechococcus sp. EJ6-Ellesmere]